MDIRGIPLGFGFALAMEPDALRNFAILPQEQRIQVIQRAKTSTDKPSMKQLVSQLASGKLS